MCCMYESRDRQFECQCWQCLWTVTVYDGPIWSAWRATCALRMLLPFLKISTLGDHTAY